MTATAINLDVLLEDLENRIDPAVEDKLYSEWVDFNEGRQSAPIFSPVRSAKTDSGIEWPDIHTNDTLDDIDLMVASQLRGCSNSLERGNAFLNVRCNYGVGIMPCLFGVEPFIMPREQDCLPNSKAFPDGADGMRAMLDRGKPDLDNGWGAKVFETCEAFKAAFAKYPKVEKYVHIYHPDLQGPMDICELLWGSDIFVDLYEEPELVHDSLKLINETYIDFMERWFTLVPPAGEYSFHWGLLIRGQIMLRDDSAMNLSPEMYREFILPYNNELLKKYGGGLHACGKVDHWIPVASELEGLSAFNMSQPSYNDMETVYRNTVDKGIQIIALGRDASEEAVAKGRDLRGKVHSW